jgi:steroid 5-alpha reductase family enzyme
VTEQAELPQIGRRLSYPTALTLVALAYAAALAGAWALAWWLAPWPPLWRAAAGDLLATAIVFAFSLALDNSSVYDPYWSLAPLPIAGFWFWLAPAEAPAARAGLVLGLLALWGLRLTFNWLRRWRGAGDEDFRYREIRARTGRAYWPAAFVSIHLLPTVWVFLGLSPLLPALGSSRPFGPLDGLAAAVTLLAIGIEWLSDRQLARFARGRSDRQAVLQTGLWAWSRHPNYFGEVLFWWGLYLFGLAAAPGAWWWTLLGPASITFLFVFISVPWMDRRMNARRPAHAARVGTVSGLVPWPPRRPR